MKTLILGLLLGAVVSVQAQIFIRPEVTVFRTPVPVPEFQYKTWNSPLGMVTYEEPSWSATVGTAHWVDESNVAYVPSTIGVAYDDFLVCTTWSNTWVFELRVDLNSPPGNTLRLTGTSANGQNPLLDVIKPKPATQKPIGKPRDSRRPPNPIRFWNPQFPSGPGFWDSRTPEEGEEFVIDKQRSRRVVGNPVVISSGTLSQDQVSVDANGKVTIGNKDTAGFEIGGSHTTGSFVNRDYAMVLITEEWIVDVWIFRNGKWVYSHSELHRRKGYRLIIATIPPVLTDITWDPDSEVVVPLK